MLLLGYVVLILTYSLCVHVPRDEVVLQGTIGGLVGLAVLWWEHYARERAVAEVFEKSYGKGFRLLQRRPGPEEDIIGEWRRVRRRRLTKERLPALCRVMHSIAAENPDLARLIGAGYADDECGPWVSIDGPRPREFRKLQGFRRLAQTLLSGEPQTPRYPCQRFPIVLMLGLVAAMGFALLEIWDVRLLDARMLVGVSYVLGLGSGLCAILLAGIQSAEHHPFSKGTGLSTELEVRRLTLAVIVSIAIARSVAVGRGGEPWVSRLTGTPLRGCVMRRARRRTESASAHEKCGN
ncbi:MAG: hypothetical protein HY814_02505 [Candidatus Riflebacteria bacterium]|nr:hypothetical protein [Candidatus Riflebacteria bacterium]